MSRFLILAACAALLSGCCSADPAPAAPGAEALDFEPVVAEPVRGICLQIPFTGCKLCLGVSCEAPDIIQPAVFGRPVVRPAAPEFGAPDPCGEVYAAPSDPCADGSCYAEPWGSSAYGSGSDDVAEYRPVVFYDDLGDAPAMSR